MIRRSAIILLMLAVPGCLLARSIQQQEIPVILNCTETALPGETIAITGHAFGNAPKVLLHFIDGKKTDVPLTLLEYDSVLISTKIPANLGTGLYAIKVSTSSGTSTPYYINRARAMAVEFNSIVPGTVFRIFGRNLSLKGSKPKVGLVADKRTIYMEIVKADAYTLQVRAPKDLAPGTYHVMISNGSGGAYGLSPFDETIEVQKPGTDPFALKVPWGNAFTFSQNVYNIKNDKRLVQQGDRQRIQEAIDKAHADGGGVVFLPAGNYKLEYTSGSGITMRSRVVLKGDGPGKTIITYGYGNPFSTERVKGPYGWPLGWPDNRSEGMALIWPAGISTSGLLDLTMRNVNESGAFVHTIKNMPEGGEQLFLQNCELDMNSGWGLAMVNVDKLLVSNCTINSTSVDVRGINAPTRTWPLDLKNSHHFIVRNNTVNYYAGRFGANGCHHAIIENNRFIRNGDHQAKGETGGLSLDYVMDMMVLSNTFDVRGAPIANRNQGETILTQGGNPYQQTLGIVTSATANTLMDRKQEFQDFTDHVMTEWQYAIHPTNYSVAIVDGRGMGQWRTITWNNDTVLSVDRPWDVIPGPGSRYVITQWSAYQMLVMDNVLKDNNRGIWVYSGNNDLVIVRNKLINSEGIYIRADQRMINKRYNLSWHTLIAENAVEDTDGRRGAFITTFLAQEKNTKLTGTGILGMVVRNNTVRAFTPNVTTSFTKGEGFFSTHQTDETKTIVRGILGSIFENNTAINTNNTVK